MADDSKILAAIEEQKSAYAAMEKAMKDGNKEVLAKAEQAYDKAKQTADGMKAVQDAQNAQQAKLEELELAVKSAAALGGGKPKSEYSEPQQAYNAAFADALRSGLRRFLCLVRLSWLLSDSAYSRAKNRKLPLWSLGSSSKTWCGTRSYAH